MAKFGKDAFCYDYAGGYDPATNRLFTSHTFSVGIFQWIPRSSGKGLKRGKVIKRITGLTSNPEAVYAAAEAFIRSIE